MKRKKTRREAVEDLKQVQEKLRQEPPRPGGYQAAEAAQVLWNQARKTWQRFPQDAEIRRAGLEVRQRYWDSISSAYPRTFSHSQNRLRAHDPSGLEDAVSFLEADPFFDCTGYRKEYLIRLLRDINISESYAERLRAVVLSLVDRRDGREFRAFCRLARKVDGAELREQLTQRVDEGDFDVRRRARWVLDALAQKDRMEQGKKS